MVYYEGLFFDEESTNKILSLESNRLEFGIEILHCTFKYLPNNEEIFNEIVGNYYEIELIGYGYNENNSGFYLKLPDELKKYYINYYEKELVLPHVTCSLSSSGESEDTKDLVFSYIENPIRLKCRFGYYIKEDNGKAFVSYDKFN